MTQITRTKYLKLKNAKIIREINEVIAPKLYNLEKGTATEREKQIIAECLGFLSIIKFSNLTSKEIKQLWEESGLKFQ